MEQKQRFFIYGRKEMGVLTLLGVLVAVFAFTLGVHLGKRVSPKPEHSPVGEADAAQTLPDKVPNQQEITEQAKNVQQHADDTLGQALHEEVIKTGIKLDQNRQTELPRGTKAEKSGAAESEEKTEAAPPTHAAAKKEEAPAETEHAAPTHAEEPVAEAPSAATGKFTLQVGSYPSRAEAQEFADRLARSELQAFVRAAEVKGKGKWFRVFTGGYPTRGDAEKAGEKLRAGRQIKSFVVSKLTD